MFTKKALAFLSINALLCAYSFVAAECDDEATRGCKVGNFNSVTVCNSVTAGSFLTPSGPLFNGLSNYAVLTNILNVNDTNNILWGASAGSLSSGISVNTGTGVVTLPVGGIFFVAYFVRFTDAHDGSDATGTAQLRQGVALTNVNAINKTFLTNADLTETIAMPVTGTALVRTTSTSDNTLSLRIGLTGTMTLPTATAPDANAQMIILQLN